MCDFVTSPDQQIALDLIKEGKNIFLTGPGGVGKSALIKSLKKKFPYKIIQRTSSTGISAFNISGITIHSFLNLGTGGKSLRQMLKFLSKSRKEYIQDMDILVIDEISMISAELFYDIDLVLKAIRGNDLPFGGVQLVTSGDFLQLENITGTIILDSFLWQKYITPVKLTTNFRHSASTVWMDLLSRLRENKCTPEDIELLKSRVFPDILEKDIHAVVLYPTNFLVNEYNRIQYAKLPGPEVVYTAGFNGNKSITVDLKRQFASKDMETLRLKKGCRVMLLRNIDTGMGMVNGALGEVVDFAKGASEKYQDVPVVVFDHSPDIRVLIDPVSWEQTVGNDTCTATQVPLSLAYASTQHKVQGLTLETAIIDAKNCFTNHQEYTSVSRVKEITGL
jgi:ATP-dependent DNA helicase PIF1